MRAYRNPLARKRNAQAGFTLIEVLIALAIISVALAAFVRVTSQATTNLGHLEQRSLALLSAENSLAELRIGALPPPGIQAVDCPQADQAFICRVRIGPSRQGVRMASVEVYPGRDSDRRLASAQTLLPERPQ